jgi:hypothetical protein
MTEAKSVTIKQSNAEQRANNTADFGELLAHYRAYFQSGATRSVEWRESQLIALRSMMKDHAEDFYTALWTDLRRNRIEADWVDVKYMTSEIDHVLAHLRHWMKPLPVSTPLVLAPSHGGSEILEWVNIMANGDSAHTQTRVGFCRTARTLTLVACATRPRTAIGSCGKSSYHREQLLNIYA